MALINCEECNNKVSSKAKSCPKCGAPIASASETIAAGTQIDTVQETSKKFKLHSIISITLIIFGLVFILPVLGSPNADVPLTPFFMTSIGIVWYIINRFRIWWHHK